MLLSGPEQMVAGLCRGLRKAGVRGSRIHSEIPIGPPRNWRYSPPVLRVMRWVITAELMILLGSAIAATITRGG